MCEGEFESLKKAYAVSPKFVPCPIAWGRFSAKGPETYFLLAEFRNVGEQVSLFQLSSPRQMRQCAMIRNGFATIGFCLICTPRLFLVLSLVEIALDDF